MFAIVYLHPLRISTIGQLFFSFLYLTENDLNFFSGPYWTDLAFVSTFSVFQLCHLGYFIHKYFDLSIILLLQMDGSYRLWNWGSVKLLGRLLIVCFLPVLRC